MKVNVLGEDTAVKASLVGTLIVVIVSGLNYLGNYVTKGEISEKVSEINHRIARMDNRIDAILLRKAAADEDLESISAHKKHPPGWLHTEFDWVVPQRIPQLIKETE